MNYNFNMLQILKSNKLSFPNMWICSLHKSCLKFLLFKYIFCFCLPYQKNSILEMFFISYFWHSKLNQISLMKCVCVYVCVCFLFALSLLNLCAFTVAHFIFPSVWFAWSLVFLCHKRKCSKCMKKNTLYCKIWWSCATLFQYVCFRQL